MDFATTRVLRLFYILPLILIVYTSSVFAQLPPPAKTDMRVLIDISGSMKQNDPNNLRVPALKLLLNLIPSDCNAGVWTFGRYVNMLVPFRAVTSDWKEMAKGQANKINYAGQFTNIGSAIEKASYGWKEADPKTQRSLILLTDGMVDISKNKGENDKERNRILNVLLPRLKKAGVKIHTIALSNNADTQLMQSLALSTDGKFAIVNNAEELLKVFVSAFDQSVEQEQVPIEGNRFAIDGSIDEFTALIFRMAGSTASQLKMPNGKVIGKNDKLKGMKWFSDDTYDLITISNPIGGNWALLADIDPDNRVTIVSDLTLSMEGLPANIVKSEVLEMAIFLKEGELKIIKPEFLSLLDITFRQDYKEGDKTWEGKLTSHLEGKVKAPRNGIYSARLNKTLLPGKHEFSVVVDGKTFQRKKKQTLTVHGEVLEVLTVEEDGEAGVSSYFLNILPKGGIIAKNDLQITATILKPDGTTTNVEPKPTAYGGWRLDVDNDVGQGVYRVTLNVTSTPDAARKISLEQGPYQIDYKQLGSSITDTITEIGAEPEAIVDPAPEEPVVGADEPLEFGSTEISEENEFVEVETTAEESSSGDEVGFEEEPASIIETIMNMDNMVLGGIIAGANILVCGVAFIAYRRFMLRKDREDEEDDLEIAAVEDESIVVDDDDDDDDDDTDDATVVVDTKRETPLEADLDLGLAGDEHEVSANAGTNSVEAGAATDSIEEDSAVEELIKNKSADEENLEANEDEFDLEADLAALVEEDTESDITLDDIEETLSAPEDDDELERDS